MARVRSVTAASTSVSSRFSVSSRMSTKTGVAPAFIPALAVEVKVNEGRMASVPGSSPQSTAPRSSAPEQEVVSRTRSQP